MKLKSFFEPSLGKIILSILIFLFLFIYGSPICIDGNPVSIDPNSEAWMKNLDPEYWGCHSEWHRHFHFIPDWPSFPPIISLLLFVVISYFFSCLIIWGYTKLKRRPI